MTTITPLPTPPARTQDAATFITNADNFMAALPVFATQASAVGTEVNANATIAATAASSATSSALAAAQSAGVIAWVSGTTYAIGNSRYSPITYQSYRRKTVGAGTLDPSADGTNWALIVQYGEAFSNVVGIAATFSLTTANLGQLVKITAAGGVITLPPIASAPAGSTIALIAQFPTSESIVKGSGSQLIVSPAGTTFNTLPINAGDQIQYVSNGVSWDVAYNCAPVTPVASNRNRITNGGCQISQVGAVVASVTPQYGGCDMFLTSIAGATGISGNIQQMLGQLTSTGYAQGLSAVSFTTGKPTFTTRTESKNIYDLSANVITVSGVFYQNTGADQPISIRIGKPSAIDNFVTVSPLFTDTSQVAVNGVYTPFKATFSLASGDAANGLEVNAFITNALTVTSKTFAVGDFQTELGPVATAFEQLHIDTIQHQCERYYREIPISIRWYSPAASALINVPIFWAGMRVTPTITQPVPGLSLNYNTQVVTATGISGGRYEMSSSATGDSYALNGVVKLSARI